MCKLNLAKSLSVLFIGTGLLAGCNEGGTPSTPKSQTAESAAEKAEDDGTEMVLDEPQEMADESGDLVIGSAAPSIAIAKWISGEPVTSFAKDSVYVVEFWATWCGPCLASMPHIASLQTEYGDKVTFIGVSDEDAETVSGFMEQTSGSGKTWSEVLTYRIAVDDDRKTTAAYREAAGRDGIPCAFIVGKSGSIEWIGHPIEIDVPLKQIVDGTWDSKKAKQLAREESQVRQALNETGPKIDQAINSEDYASAVSLVDGLLKRFPTNAELQLIRFRCLLVGGMWDDVNKSAKILIEASNNDARELDQLAWMLATGSEEPGADLELALSAIKRAVELTHEEEISPIETMARVYFRMGNVDEAIALQKKTLQLASNPRQIQQLSAGLAKYEEAKGTSGTSVEPVAAP